MTAGERRKDDEPEHEHEHTHPDGTRHSHPHSHEGEHRHDHAAAGEAARGGADLPPRPTQQGDGQEAGTARPDKPHADGGD